MSQTTILNRSGDRISRAITHLSKQLDQALAQDQPQIALQLVQEYHRWTKEHQKALELLSKYVPVARKLESPCLVDLLTLQCRIYLDHCRYQDAQRSIQLLTEQDQFMGYQMQIQLHLSQGLKLNALLTKANTVDEIIYAGKTSLSLHLYEDTKALLDKLQSLERDPIQVLDGLFLECFYHLGIGKVKQCQTLLKSLHQMLEDHVDVKSRKQSKRYLLGFLVSGMVHKHSDCKTSKMFLSQGIIRVKTLLQEPLNCEDAQYLADLHTLLLKNLGQVCLLMSNLDEAAQVMIECTHKAMQYDRWTEWQDSIMMDWTLLMQQVGYQDKASILLNKLKTSSNPTVSSVAQSNALLLNMDSPDWSYLLSQMETKTFYSKSIASYLQGMKHLQHQEYQPTKQQMLKTIEFTQIACDTQLQTMCLAILGQLFQNTEPQQALKVRLAGLDMARKKHLPQLVLAIGHDLQSVQPSDTLQQEMNETQEKMEQSKAKAREQLQAAFPTLFQKEQ